jgi:hypothetical protein
MWNTEQANEEVSENPAPAVYRCAQITGIKGNSNNSGAKQRMAALDRATTWFRVFGPSSFNTALQLVLRPHFLVHFVLYDVLAVCFGPEPSSLELG